MSQHATAVAKPRRSFKEFIRADKTQRALVMVTFMFAPLVLLAMFTYIPFGKMIEFSFYNRNYLNTGTFVGLQNYIDVFKRSEIFGSLIVFFLIVEPHGLARLWSIGKEKLRLWPFPAKQVAAELAFKLLDRSR